MARPHRRGWTIALEGPSGVGKSTLARALARAHGGRWIPEAVDRLHRRPDLRVPTAPALLRVERTLLAEEARRWSLARRLSARGTTVILDTGPLGPWTYSFGLAQVDPRRDVRREVTTLFLARRPRGAPALPDVTYVLELPAPSLRRRSGRDPRRVPSGLRARHHAVARHERAFWRRLAGDLPPGRVRFLSARGAPGEVLARLRRDLARRPPPALSDREEAVLRAHLEAGAKATVKR